MAIDKLLITDFETTGLDPQRHEIIEIGAILCDADTLDIFWEYDQMMLPAHIETADPRALEVNGYSAHAWRNVGLDFKRGFSDFVARLDNTMVLTGQNVWFDLGFYQAGLVQCDLKDVLDYHRLDIASMVFPFMAGYPSLSLSKTAPMFGIAPEPAVHRGINGARNAYGLLVELKKMGRMARWGAAALSGPSSPFYPEVKAA